MTDDLTSAIVDSLRDRTPLAFQTAHTNARAACSRIPAAEARTCAAATMRTISEAAR